VTTQLLLSAPLAMVLVALAVAIVGVVVLRHNSESLNRNEHFNVRIANINSARLHAWAPRWLTDVVRNIPPMLPSTCGASLVRRSADRLVQPYRQLHVPKPFR
jgi:hypothetical protein